tara:strand:- start:285 stop:542 length:258 start_codon:yes stop_codon:yes gene_type:complete
MDRALLISLIAAVMNIMLSVIVPCILKRTKSRTFLREIKITFLVHRQVLLTSTILTAIMVYFSVKIEPEVRKTGIDQLMNFFQLK